MKIEVRYETNYRYEREVSFSPHTFRLFPKTDYFVSIDSICFNTNEQAVVQHRRDIFDNPIVFWFYPEPGQDLHAELTMTLRLREKNAFQFLLASHALDFPFAYENDERRVLAPYLSGSGAVQLPFWTVEKKPTVEALVDLLDAIFKNFRYEDRDVGRAFIPAET